MKLSPPVFAAWILGLGACPSDKGATATDATATDATDTTGATATDTGADATGVPTGSGTGAASEGPIDCGPDTCPPCGADCDPAFMCMEGMWSCICDCNPQFTSGTETTGGASTGAGSSSSGGDASVMCAGDPPQFPEFDRTCAVTDDCAIGLHQVDCCGSFVALGLRADALDEFAAAEATCEMQYPGCGCAAQPTVADDGDSAPDVDAIAVACSDGQCRSFVP